MSYRIVPVIQILDLSIFSAVIITAEHAAPDNMDTQHATDQYHVYCREVIERQQIKKKKRTVRLAFTRRECQSGKTGY